MSKRASDFRPDGLTRSEPSPPQLSEKLIARLQMAVSAAQRNRVAQPEPEEKGGATADARKHTP